MTTPWNITREWEGKTVAVFGSGPSLTQAVVERLESEVDHAIVVNYAYRMVPLADMLVAIDSLHKEFWEEVKDVPMRKVTALICDVDALYCGHRWEEVQLAPGHRIHVLNSGLLAFRLAYVMGAAKIVLVGFSPDKFEHFAGHPPVEYHEESITEPYPGVKAALESMIAEMRGKGIEIERI